jgi:hypothetical protein
MIRSIEGRSPACAKLRERVVDFLAGSNEYGSTGLSLQRYFDHFALAARRAHFFGPGVEYVSQSGQ